MINKDFYSELEEFIAKLSDKKDDVKILNYVLDRLGAIPKEVQKFIAEKTGLMEITIENTINFYPKFRGKDSRVKEVAVCVGMNCGPAGGQQIYNELVKILEPDEKGLSKDGKILLTTKRCFGRCAKGPNVSIDGVIYSLMNLQDVKRKLGL
ncbi:NAD(P)H-dependent oxidoreductase subunit E [Fusobacterium sp.]|uniref:NADH-quinone oxidoreductase subunit NuoE family protein n=1 Tax=Fusobacterium sp. TaxID=68766 RepID=UPI0025C079AF|nr:NAD(P)H-dependent oxidoreductase subunit E [Fusobacterium sp.]